MTTYIIRNKITEKEAIQYHKGMDDQDVLNFMGESGYGTDENHIYIHTTEGVMKVSDTDWVIKGLEGEFYPCKDSVFKNSYEKIGSKISE